MSSSSHLSSFLDTDPSPLPSPAAHDSHFLPDPHPDSAFSDNDNDTASQKSISLSSPPHSPPPNHSSMLDTPALLASPPPPITPVTLIRQNLNNRESNSYTLDTDLSSEVDADDDRSLFMKRLDDEDPESPVSSLAPSIVDNEKDVVPPLPSSQDLRQGRQSASSMAGRPLPSTPPRPTLPLPSPAVPPVPPLPPRFSTSTSTSTSSPSAPASIAPPPLPSRKPLLSASTTFPVNTPTTYPPPPIGISLANSRESVSSFASSSTTYSKKARPESLLLQPPNGPLVLGIALVDFNHLVGPKIEFSRGDIFEDEEIAKILPFLALPDGAHLTTEDYSYFHLVPSASKNPSTLFGISCNRQIKTTELTTKHPDVTRSTVQKAIVVLASKPVFGPIRDRLGVITRTLFAQRDFSDLSILDAFHESLEASLRSQLTESGLYMGTSLRELVHTFRQRTLVLLKALMLQKKIMFYGHPVERLCTFQYSLITLVPGLLQNLDDSGSPPLAERARGLKRPTELKTSDRKSMMAYIGLPLDLFGKDAFFQPYLPLQQLDMLKDTASWLCGSTNSIVAQQKEVDILVNIETGSFEFRDPKLERSAGLTAADRKWMDDIVRDVNDHWVDEDGDGTQGYAVHFKGSDDYLRQKFEEYISGALASVKYADFIAKGQGNGVLISDGSGDPKSVEDFNMLWISEFKKTNAYEVWERVTDPLLFDIVEPRHPCSERPSVVSDIGLRLSEGIQELKLDQQLAPTREAISRTLNAGSTNFFKAVEGVRGRWMMSRNPSASSSTSTSVVSGGETSSTSSSTVEISNADLAAGSGSGSGSGTAGSSRSRQGSVDTIPPPSLRNESGTPPPPSQPLTINGMRPLSLAGSASASASPSRPVSTSTTASSISTPDPVKATLSSWGVGIGSFFSQRASRLSSVSTPRRTSTSTLGTSGTTGSGMSQSREASPSPAPAPSKPEDMDLGEEELKPKDLDKVYSKVEGA